MLHSPRYAGAYCYGRRRGQRGPDGTLTITAVPRPEWTAFIPGAHPGYITLEEFDANQARLAAAAAAHGGDRKAGPPREGPALCQGIIICGRCGQRMTAIRRGAEQPYYLCQRPGIQHAAAICQTIPGAGIDTAVGRLLIGALTPLAIEAALTVAAELEHRAGDADKLRAAVVERASYHADAARRRYLAVDPGNRLVAATLEASWNTALRELDDARDAYDKAAAAATAGLTGTQKARITQLTSDFPAIWNDPATPQRERKRMARLLLTDITVTKDDTTITCHARLSGGQHHTLTLPRPRPAPELRKTPPARRRGPRRATRPPHLRRDRRRPQRPRPGHRRRPPVRPRQRRAHPPRLPAAQPPPAPRPRRPDHPHRDGRPPGRVPEHRQELAPCRDCQRPAV